MRNPVEPLAPSDWDPWAVGLEPSCAASSLLTAALALLQLSCAKPTVPGSRDFFLEHSRSYLWNSRFVKPLTLGLGQS